MMPKHWIAMAGMHGCLPSTCNAYSTLRDAAESLADLHELGRDRRRELARNRYLELTLARDGNEYAEITSCSCATPEVHNDEG